MAEQDFDIVCKKFMTVCLTQCPVPGGNLLHSKTFTGSWPCLEFYRVTSAAVWLKEISPVAFDGKINLEEPPAAVVSPPCSLKRFEAVCSIPVFHRANYSVQPERRSTEILFCVRLLSKTIKIPKRGRTVIGHKAGSAV